MYEIRWKIIQTSLKWTHHCLISMNLYSVWSEHGDSPKIDLTSQLAIKNRPPSSYNFYASQLTAPERDLRVRNALQESKRGKKSDKIWWSYKVVCAENIVEKSAVWPPNIHEGIVLKLFTWSRLRFARWLAWTRWENLIMDHQKA